MSPAVFSHGDLRLYLLSLLAEAPQHGYGIIQSLTDRTGGTYTPSAGTIRRATVDIVSGSTLVDAAGDVNAINVNSVSGGTTVRLDESLAANYVVRSLSGRLLIDGVERGSSGINNYTGSTGELAGRFVDLRANSVSGGVTVLRRTPSSIENDPEWEEA
jgi:hypothetical protein